jgi:hypothetical protein
MIHPKKKRKMCVLSNLNKPAPAMEYGSEDRAGDREVMG